MLVWYELYPTSHLPGPLLLPVLGLHLHCMYACMYVLYMYAYFIYVYIMCVCVCLCMHLSVHACQRLCGGRSEDNVQERGFSFHPAGPGVKLQSTSLAASFFIHGSSLSEALLWLGVPDGF